MTLTSPVHRASPQAAAPARGRHARGGRRLPLPLALLAAGALLVGLAAPAAAKPIARARWLGRVTVTEYYPVPEAWFVGKKVRAPGLTTKHRIDWLYSATGLSMEGDGIGLDGRRYHIASLGRGGWVDERGKPSVPGARGWRPNPPVWRAGGYWLSRRRRLTFPLDGGGWSNGVGRRYVPLPGVSFALGPSRPLRYYRSLAVDPDLIPLGSRVYIPAYRDTAGGGWFRAEDVGGAIIGRHVDVFRPPPPRAGMSGNYLANQRIYVIPPGRKPGRDAPSTARSQVETRAAPTSPASPTGGAGAP